ncbi:hypothetical protein DFJ58DRAFT_667761, partial [Suillus subalutaceus]|uniref:uncharacterized protein n=1 Tax=Suillus subalutaceus TaxID=48586 RepID=UPI001B876588
DRLMTDWTSPIYAFFEPTPEIEYHDNRRCHVFKCAVRGCKHKVRQYLDKKDAKYTGNMRKHVKSCWGEAALQMAMEHRDTAAAQDGVVKDLLETGTIKSSFERKGKGKVTYSHRQHTHTETRAEIVRWVSESLRPFETVNDRGFQNLMKTGRPEYYIPSPSTVARDVKQVFVKTCEQIARMLQNYDGKLNFGTDAWTSPNHRAYVAISVHLEHEGQPFSMILDIVEVAKVHKYTRPKFKHMLTYCSLTVAQILQMHLQIF